MLPPKHPPWWRVVKDKEIVKDCASLTCDCPLHVAMKRQVIMIKRSSTKVLLKHVDYLLQSDYDRVRGLADAIGIELGRRGVAVPEKAK